METVQGTVEKIRYSDPGSGYTVAVLKTDTHHALTLVGNLHGLQPGVEIFAQGSFESHPMHGQQFKAQSYQTSQPSQIQGIKKYLGSGMIKGLGPKTSDRIVEFFGKETLNILDQTPERLREIPGIGPKTIQNLVKAWKEQHAIRDVMIFLQQHDISPIFAQKIFKRYGQQTIELLTQNPYRLASDLHGVGFLGADKLAQRLGITPESPERIAAGILFVFEELTLSGHTCHLKTHLIELAQEKLGVTQERVETELEALITAKKIIEEPIQNQPFVFLAKFFFAEYDISKKLRELTKHSSKLRPIQIEKALTWAEEKLQIELAPTQKQACTLALEEKVAIITGGPGTGKSTITHAIVQILKKLTSKIALMAPTGRAAKRMQEITGELATTIHAKLEIDFAKGGFKKGPDDPLDVEVVILDEASMVDTPLFQHLLLALPKSTKLLLIGDIHQLPSVGPGSVLKDLIASKQVPTCELTEIFRQAQGSKIITNAHMIQQGRFPDLSVSSTSDFFFVNQPDPEKLLTTILDLVTYRLPKHFKLDPIEDIQVLSPMRKGHIGIEKLNQELQKKLNPRATKPLERMGRTFQVGDKVLQTRNQHQQGIYNGDIGRIKDIDHQNQELCVAFDSHIVSYDFQDLDQLTLAYAVSVHKYQGSETPCVVIPVHTQHYVMLQRNLLYTAVTRGKKLVVLAGSKKAIYVAIEHTSALERYTGLQHALAHAFTPLPKGLFELPCDTCQTS